MARAKSILDPKMQRLNDKLKTSGVKVSHRKERRVKNGDLGRQRNSSYTAGAQNNQAYDKESKQFTKGSSSSMYGRLAVEGETNAKNARTWTFTQKDADGNTIRQSGRSQIATRRQRYYDVRKGLGLSGG